MKAVGGGGEGGVGVSTHKRSIRLCWEGKASEGKRKLPRQNELELEKWRK